MPEKEITIRRGQIMKCAKCSFPSRFPVSLSESDLPVEFFCRKCNQEYKWDKLPILPKVEPTPNLPDFCFVNNHDEQQVTTLTPLEPGEISTGKLEIQPAKSPEESHPIPTSLGTPIPFWKRAKGIGVLVSQLVTESEELEFEINQFRGQMQRHFVDQSQYARRYSEQWSSGYLREFLDFPFISLSIPCETELSGHYSRWIISPKFFDPSLGFKIQGGHGGFRLEIVNQYSRMNFPMDENIVKKLGVPETLDLEVKGNKIVGSSLQFCYEDIPGLAKDSDFSSEWASVYMLRPALSRRWLANHGIIPWDLFPLEKKDITEHNRLDEIIRNRELLEAFRIFKQTGHLGIFWQDSMKARQSAIELASMVRGTKAVFTTDKKSRMIWDSLYHGHVRKGESRANELLFFDNRSEVLWPSVMNLKMIIIDAYDTIDAERLERLLTYQGRLLVLADNPLLDYNEINMRAGSLHALAGWEVFDKFETPKGWSPLTDHNHMKKDYDDVCQALLKLQKDQGKNED